MTESQPLTVAGESGKYQKAETVVGAVQICTGEFIQPGSRAVTTTITQGNLTLRYTPQEPKQERIPTSS